MTHFRDAVKVVEGELIDKVETKVKAASTAGAVSGVIVSLLGHYVFKGAVPEVLQALIDAAVTAGLTFFAGWWAKHTPRVIDARDSTPPNITDLPPAGPSSS